MTPTSVTLFRDEKSPFWFVYWMTASGRRVKRSTKVPHAGGMYCGEHLSKAQAEKRAYAVGYKMAAAATSTPEGQSNISVRELFDKMLSGKLGRVSAKTYDNARTDYRQFCEWLGKRANEPARLIRKADINDFVMHRRTLVRRETVHKAMSVISAAFNWAVDSEMIPSNPCRGIRIAPDTRDEKIKKEAFTVEEIRLLIDKLPDEWSSAVRCCVATYGQRLGDILNLKWEQLDFSSRVVRLTTGKTARVLMQPMQPDFYDWAIKKYAEAQQKGGDAAIYVHPRLRLHSNPSGEFTQLVRLHGMGLKGEDAGGKRRTWHSKTFHSLRASVASILSAAGVNEIAARHLVGHDSKAIHQAYFRPTVEQMAVATANMPNF